MYILLCIDNSVEMSVDQDDIKKFEKELGVNKSKYLDETILQELILKNKV